MHRAKTENLPTVTTERIFKLSKSRHFFEQLRASQSNKIPANHKTTIASNESFLSNSTGSNRSLTPQPPKFSRTGSVNTIRRRFSSASSNEKQKQLVKGQLFPDRVNRSCLNSSTLSKCKNIESNTSSFGKANHSKNSLSATLTEVPSKPEHQRRWTSLREQHLSKPPHRPGTPIFRSKGQKIKKGEISVNSFFVSSTSESTKWQLCGIAKIQNKQKKNSKCSVEELNTGTNQRSQMSCDRSVTSETDNYFTEDNRQGNAFTRTGRQSSLCPVEINKISNLLGNKYELVENERFGDTLSYSPSLHSSDSEENCSAVCPKQSKKNRCCCSTKHQGDLEDHLKATRISDWIVQVSEKMKYVS